MEGLKDNYTVQAWLVLLLSMLFGVSLAVVQLTLAPKITANKINETRRMVPELVLGSKGAKKLAKKSQSLDIEIHKIGVSKDNRKTFYSVFQARDKGKTAGWVVKSSGQGYADKIEVLIGFDPLMRGITGLFILEQKETPGLGNKIADEKWRNQFINKGLDKPLKVSKTGSSALNEINAITGATISSRSICTIINTAANDLKEPIISKKLKQSSIKRNAGKK